MNNATSLQQGENSPPSAEIASLIKAVDMVCLVSGIYLAIIAVVTVFGNGLLLLAIIKDPFKAFRTPTTVFVVGLALADFLTGLIVDPLTAFLDIASYLKLFNTNNANMAKILEACIHVNSHISFITMNVSFLILLALTFCQYVAISFPHKHRTLVIRRNTIIALAAITVYSVIFSLLSEFEVPLRVKLEIDTLLNTNGVAIIVLLCYVLLYRAHRVHQNSVSSLDDNDAQRKRRREQQREFTALNLLLVTFLLIFTLPSIIFWNLMLYNYYDQRLLSRRESLRLDLSRVLIFDVLVMKFALDPCIYAWRLSRYRQAITNIMKCGRGGLAVDENTSSRVISTFVDGGDNQERPRTSSMLIPLNNPSHRTASETGS